MERIPEPELMDSPEQTAAYAAADFATSNQLFVDQLLAYFQPIPATGHLFDLGCGPADITIRLARALPRWNFTGLDGGPNMLQCGIEACQQAALSDRIRLKHSYLPDDSLPPSSADAVVSNSLLHHLPEPVTLWQTLCQLARPGAYIQVMDLQRPDDIAAARALCDEYANGEPEVLRQDFYNSLLAAYTVAEVRAQLDTAGLYDCRIVQPSDRHWMVRGYVPAIG